MARKKVREGLQPSDWVEPTLGEFVEERNGWNIYKGTNEYGNTIYRCFVPYDEPEVGYEDWETDTLPEAQSWIDNYSDDLLEGPYDDELCADWEDDEGDWELECDVPDDEDDKEVLVEDSDDPIDYLDKNDLGNLIKSSGGEVDGSESEDELRGMYKAMSAVSESFQRRAKRLASAKKTVKESKKVKTEGGLITGKVGGMKIELILRFPEGDIRVDGDAVCEDIVRVVSEDGFGNIRVPDGTNIDINEVTFTELPRSMFESKAARGNLPKYKGKYNNKPDECTPYVKVLTDDPTDMGTWYTYEKAEDARKVAEDIYTNPDKGVKEVHCGVITTGPDFRENVFFIKYIDEDGKVKYESKQPKSRFVKKDDK